MAYPFFCLAVVVGLLKSGYGVCVVGGQLELAESQSFHLLQTGLALDSLGEPQYTQPEEDCGYELPAGAFVRNPQNRTGECVAATLYPTQQQAMIEAGPLTCGDLSVYGAHVPKMPLSVVNQVSAMKQASVTKSSNYNFQGRVAWLHNAGPTASSKLGVSKVGGVNLNAGCQAIRRQWAVDFADSYFSENDIFSTEDDRKSHDVIHLAENVTFDYTYWENMIRSNFTLCPGGDQPWSNRFFEAIAAGSIPVIDSEDQDFSSDHHSVSYWFKEVGYVFFTTEQVVSTAMTSEELQRIADGNYRLFVKFQTFMEGDNVPAAYAEYSGPCLEHAICSQMCLQTEYNCQKHCKWCDDDNEGSAGDPMGRGLQGIH